MPVNKIYCGNAKEITFNDGGSLIAATLDLGMLLQHEEEFGFTTTGGKRTIKIKVCQSRETDRYGNTHYLEIDQWKPDGSRAAAPKPAPNYGSTPPPGPPSPNPDDDIPF